MKVGGREREKEGGQVEKVREESDEREEKM